MEKKQRAVNPAKVKAVEQLATKIKKSKTFMIVSIKSVPSKQFQEIKKGLREIAFVQVAKKNIILRTIEKLENENALPLEQFIKENSAIVISDIDGFELASELNKKRTPVFAKAGQIAPEDIEVKEGPTDLVPGPAISEFGALGIEISVENGKIVIKKPKVLVKEGGEIKENVVSILQKLNIQPFNVGLDPVAVYDVEKGKIYIEIKIDSEGFTEQLKESASKALGFAQKISYYCKETIVYLLVKANSEASSLNKLQIKEDSQINNSEEIK
jgi:large subunit ribosomal protein L10